MSITLIATIVALVLGHLAPSLAAAVRQFGWYADLIGWLNDRFGEGSFWRGRWGIVLALLPPVMVVGFFQLALDERLLGIAELVFGLAVLFLVWGPRDLDRDVDAILDAPDAASRRERVTRLAGNADAPESRQDLVEAVFRNALRRWFGVLFWFLLLGPVGAVAYRLSALAAVGDAASRVPARTRQGARTWLAVLEWPVAQLMTLALALVGNFDSVLGAWRSAGGASFAAGNRFLGAAARASVRREMADEGADYAVGDGGIDDDSFSESWLGTPSAGLGLSDLPELRDAMSLVWRSLLAWLAVLALFVIAGFVS
ncbi:MAG: regulatory signaling modulator protein AmpE [Lysobacter sp.]